MGYVGFSVPQTYKGLGLIWLRVLDVYSQKLLISGNWDWESVSAFMSFAVDGSLQQQPLFGRLVAARSLFPSRAVHEAAQPPYTYPTPFRA